ncbi:xylose isomerase [Neobacillus cucumis]|nr:xylose isomerase [Neobacillus cucumis]
MGFKYYNLEEVITGKTMKDHLRFSVAYWHTFSADGTDPFGVGTMHRPWDCFSGMDLAKSRVEARVRIYKNGV